MFRVVLAVALAVALLAVVQPALDDARTTRTERLAGRELDRIAAAATALADEEAPGARRTLTVSLPRESPSAAGLDTVALGGLPANEAGRFDANAVDTDESDVLAVRVGGGRRRVRRVGVDLRVVRRGRVADRDGRALVLAGGGTYRVVLRLVRLDGRRVVSVTATGAETTAPKRRGSDPSGSEATFRSAGRFRNRDEQPTVGTRSTISNTYPERWTTNRGATDSASSRARFRRRRAVASRTHWPAWRTTTATSR